MACVILFVYFLADSQFGFEEGTLKRIDSSGINMGAGNTSRRMGLKVFLLVVAACRRMDECRYLRHLKLEK